MAVPIIHTVAIQFVDLGFKRLYDVEVNPEYPSSGSWPFPSRRFGGRGRDTLTIKVRTREGRQWAASFSLERRAAANGVYSCPNPGQVLVATGLDAYLLEADDLSRADAIPIHPVSLVFRPDGIDVVLVASNTGIACLGDFGLRWVANQLVLDDLEVLDYTPDVIRVRGRDRQAPDRTTIVALDAKTGNIRERDSR